MPVPRSGSSAAVNSAGCWAVRLRRLASMSRSTVLKWTLRRRAVAATHVEGDYSDVSALLAWAKSCDVVTYEFENVPVEAAQALIDAGVSVRPGAKALEVSQDRLVEKNLPAGLWDRYGRFRSDRNGRPGCRPNRPLRGARNSQKPGATVMMARVRPALKQAMISRRHIKR